MPKKTAVQASWGGSQGDGSGVKNVEKWEGRNGGI